jgi:hypothetical protein
MFYDPNSQESFWPTPPCRDGGAEMVAVSFDFGAASQTQAVPISERSTCANSTLKILTNVLTIRHP